jgi:hypothetical protein
MYRTVLTVSSAILLLGSTSAAYAQQGSGATALSRLQSRSIQSQYPGTPRPYPSISGNVPPQITPAAIDIDPVTSQIVINRFSDRSQLVIGPTKEDRQLSAPPGAGFSGNNRVQIL